jgi:hypothetical protein
LALYPLRCSGVASFGMVTIRAVLLVVALLVAPAMPASAGLADADAGWGEGGFVDVGFYPAGFSPEPDGTVWVVGYDIDTFEGRMAHIDHDGTLMTSVPFADDVPVGQIGWVGRTPDGFALLTYTDTAALVFRVDSSGELDQRFGVTEPADTGLSEVGVGFLVMGDRVLVSGTRSDASGVVGAVHAFGPDGALDPSFGAGGVLELPGRGQASAVEIVPAASGISVALIDEDEIGRSTMVHLVEVSASGVVGGWASVVDSNLDIWDFDGVRRPDGSVVLARVGAEFDLGPVQFEVITFSGSEGEVALAAQDAYPNGATVAADRTGATAVFVSGFGGALMVDAETLEVTPVGDPAFYVVAAGTDWLTGSVYLGWNDGRVQRSAPDGSGRFTDDDRSVHEGDIAELASSGITRGCNPPLTTRFCPDEAISRGEMAALLARALDLPAGEASFADVADSVFSADIAALAASGITKGCTADRFCPDDPVTRGQMAAFLTRALGLDPGPDAFTDDVGDIFEADINALAAAGITRGCTGESFCPDEQVTRAQMASFLVRAGLAG